MLARTLRYASRKNSAPLQIITCSEIGRLQLLCCAKSLQPRSLHTRKHAASTVLCTAIRDISANLSEQNALVSQNSSQRNLGDMRF